MKYELPIYSYADCRRKGNVREADSERWKGICGHAQILLKLDKKIPENKEWTYEKIGKAYGATEHTISKLAEKFVTEGLEALLTRKEQQNRCRKITGDIEARLVAIACSNPPEGCARWTLQLLADELIRLEIVDYVTDTTVGEVLKKTLYSRGGKRMVYIIWSL
ncbi:hypothetical protein FACS1894200_05190 [Spirochaetia bacterium]|nr:hypothetical protein FACS1894200_05190 [Spirochaetia bacterium]